MLARIVWPEILWPELWPEVRPETLARNLHPNIAQHLAQMCLARNLVARIFVGPIFAVRNYSYINAPWDEFDAIVENLMQQYDVPDFTN